MSNYHVLTEGERNRLERKEGDDIIAAGLWIKGSCELAHRAVIRDLGDKFVVHFECVDEGIGPYFHQGTYLPKSNPLALERAWAEFNRRTRQHMNWGEGCKTN